MISGSSCGKSVQEIIVAEHVLGLSFQGNVVRDVFADGFHLVCNSQ